ncbi:50S ribosomal protein L22 [bacterium]|nr:50S ribosomal protein L22 [bacterium]
MEAKAVLRFLRISPTKTRMVTNMIKGKYVSEALALLKFTEKGAGTPIYKLLNSAITNAENNFNADIDDLRIKNIFVDEGPMLKRYRPAAMGRATRIRKRTSHVTIIVSNE